MLSSLPADGQGGIGVIDMDLLSVIRRWHFRQGISIREIKRRTGGRAWMVRQTTLTHNALFPLVSERLQTERSVDSPYKIPKSRQDGGVCGRGRNPTLRIWASDIPRLD
jgi:hypothetical protein